MGRSWNGRIKIAMYSEDKPRWNRLKEIFIKRYKLKQISDPDTFTILLLDGNNLVINENSKKLKEIKSKLQI